MWKLSKNMPLDVARKNRRKMVKTIMQSMVLLLVGWLIFHAVFDTARYSEPDRSGWSNDQGFIALSYFGVGRNGTSKLIAKREIEQQLQALVDQGYVTISQQDILDYYQQSRPLPDKALFLSFEDGRNDSSLFTQPLLEKYNFKATFLSYANKMGNGERKFVQPKQLLKMAKTGYWELGSNGYRLSYINVFDHEGRYVGMRDENEVTTREHLAHYNHYLMDFMRDENMIPTEHSTEMKARIDADYEAMKNIYSKELGYVPGVYMIMHANSMYSGMNRLVEEANSSNIEQLFSMHFNREGMAYNSKEDSLYNLTRVQVAPYWYTNHLLMKLHKDTGQKMDFVRGDQERASEWKMMSGAAEFSNNRIILTSPPAQAGKLYLKDSGDYGDIKLTADLSGNVIGRQSVYVRYSQEQESYLRVTIENNRLVVGQKLSGQEENELFSQELSKVNWSNDDIALTKASSYTLEQSTSGMDELYSDGEYPINLSNSRKLEVSVQGNKLTVAIDQEIILTDGVVDESLRQGGVALESSYSSQNTRDDIYDAVFDDITVEQLNEQENELTELYTNKNTGIQATMMAMKSAYSATIDWMIETF